MSTTHRISFASDRGLPRVEQLKEGDIAEWLNWIGGDEDTIATAAPTPACVELRPETPDTLPVCSALTALVDRWATLEGVLPCLKHLSGEDVVSWMQWVGCVEDTLCEWDCPISSGSAAPTPRSKPPAREKSRSKKIEHEESRSKKIEPDESRSKPPACAKSHSKEIEPEESRSKPPARAKSRSKEIEPEESRSKEIEPEESERWEQSPPNKQTRLALANLMRFTSPYMTYQQKQAAAKTLGLSIMQVTTFCNNYRERFCKTEGNKPMSFQSLVNLHATVDKKAKK
ncbi:hypothetical protein T484DRAFT_1756103 [Baffinella frigidus]|nr:hypothetical protein T484DRAFT_1756103 [Cryptophyta sp. CCMP2293]